jgi:anhydro-N-acetylmuramic acid kinase
MYDSYLAKKPPKSTGREYYGTSYVKNLLSAARHHHVRPADLVRAVTVFTALSVIDALNRFVLPKHKIDQLIVSGGGAKNPLIMAQLQAALTPHVGAQHAAPQLGKIPTSSKPKVSSPPPTIEILPSDDLGVPTAAKEAFAFALMAYETFHQRPSNLPSATGARGPAILGKISYAPR